jgi:hypothetical protein
MAKNKLSDLNNHLFEQMERLNDEELSPEQFGIEMKRAKAMGEIAVNIIEINKISMDALKLIAKGEIDAKDLPTEIDTVKPKQLKN